MAINENDIEEAVCELQNKVSASYKNKISDPIQLLHPGHAAFVLGYDYQERESLGQFGFKGDRFEVAGYIDRGSKVLAVSKRFNENILRFTGAHELAHIVLHLGESYHRDRPVSGLAKQTYIRPPIEREADSFAARFLMPKNLVKTRLEETFGLKEPIVFDDVLAYHLAPDDSESLLRADTSGLEREIALASREKFAGRRFNSLAKQFCVSVSSMAIRLKELGVITN
jgi:Zn-dependent peptidase ImmA (M78 family)